MSVRGAASFGPCRAGSVTGLRCIRCLADVLRTGAPKPGCSYDDPTPEAKYVFDGEAICDPHARERLGSLLGDGQP